jgi:hypothetical protein
MEVEMNRIPYIIMAALCAMSVAQLFAMRHEASAQTSPTAQATADAIQAYGFPPTSDPNGGWTPRQNFAAYPWRDGTLIPARPDGLIDPETGRRVLQWPIQAELAPGEYGTVWFGKDKETDAVGKWRSSNWSQRRAPLRWAYVRKEPEVWNEQMQRMEIPGLPWSPTPAPPATPGKAGVHMDNTQGQWMVDDLKRSFTTSQIQDFIDASPYDEPDTGAPEPQP